jgi:acetyl-CoA carboxylase beta subunit
MIDMVVRRHDLRDNLARIISLLRNTGVSATSDKIVELPRPAAN